MKKFLKMQHALLKTNIDSPLPNRGRFYCMLVYWRVCLLRFPSTSFEEAHEHSQVSTFAVCVFVALWKRGCIGCKMQAVGPKEQAAK